MNWTKLITFMPVRYFLPLIWIISIIIIILYAYTSTHKDFSSQLIQQNYTHAKNFFNHSRENASHALSTNSITHIRKMFTFYSSYEQQDVGLYSFKTSQDLGASHLEILLAKDEFNAKEKLNSLQKEICQNRGTITLWKSENQFYLFSALNEQCDEWLFYQRIDLNAKLDKQENLIVSLLKNILIGLVIAMLIIRIIIYFSFNVRLKKLFTIMNSQANTFNSNAQSLEGNDELAKISKAFTSATYQMSAILNDMYTFVALIDTQGKIIFVNNTPLSISKLTLQEVQGKIFTDSPWWSYSKETQTMIENLLQQAILGEVIHHDIQIMIADNKLIWITFSLHPVYNSEGHLLHVVAEGVDITQQKIAHEQLLQQSRKAQMGEMISIIAHQWRQPLSVINSIAGNIQLDSSLQTLQDAQIQTSMKNITQTTQHLSDTMNQFMSFFNPNKIPKKSSFKAIVEQSQNLLAPILLKNNITLTCKLENEVMIKTFEEELIQVIIDMLKNSQDFFTINSIENPKISIKHTIENNYSVLYIEDNAGGIDDDTFKHIFEPYFSTKKESSSGLGLHMSKMIVEEHCNGKLEAVQRDKGIVFMLSLPIDENIA